MLSMGIQFMVRSAIRTQTTLHPQLKESLVAIKLEVLQLEQHYLMEPFFLQIYMGLLSVLGNNF